MNKETIQKLVASACKDDVYLGIAYLGEAIKKGEVDLSVYHTNSEDTILSDFPINSLFKMHRGGIYFGGFSLWIGYSELIYTNETKGSKIKNLWDKYDEFLNYE